MAEMIKMRTGNHKAEWSEDALIILEEFATVKVQGRAGACGRILPYVQKIIPLLEVEPRGEPPEEYLLMERRKGVDLSKQPKGASVLTCCPCSAGAQAAQPWLCASRAETREKKRA